MSAGFNHSIKVPRIYKIVAKLVRSVREEGIGLKQLLYEQRHPNISGIYALALNVLQHGDQLDRLIRDTQILIKESRLDPWLARVLITELLWGKKCLQSDCKPVQTVLSYKELLWEESLNIATPGVPGKKRVKKPRYVRVNVLTTTVEKAISSFKDEGWQLLPRCKDYSSYIASLSTLSGSSFAQDINIPELLAFPFGKSFHSHSGYLSGAIILQDKASCLPAFLLNPPPGSVVLDLCAAPGMKTTHLSAMMQNRGKIYAVEQNRKRYDTLCQMILAANSYCVKTINADGLTVDARQCPDVEYILVDPSCSGSGILDRLEVGGGIEKQTPDRLKTLQSVQVYLLRHSLFNFPSAKRVVYSTCSIHPEENEQVIDEVLSDVGDAYKLIPVKKLLDGKWLNFSSVDYKCKDNCLYAKPEVDLTNGFFVAVFERNSDVLLPDRKCRKGKFIKERSEEIDNKVSKLNGNGEEKQNVQALRTEDGVEMKLGKKERKRSKEVDTYAREMADIAKQENETVTDLEQHREIEIKTKEKKREKATEEITETVEPEVTRIKSKKKKKKRKKSEEEIEILEESAEIEVSEIKSKKKKKKKKKRVRDEIIDIVQEEVHVSTDSGEVEVIEVAPKKKKKIEIIEIIEERDEIEDESSIKMSKEKSETSNVSV